MSNDELIRLLNAIQKLALVPYPFPEGVSVHPSLALALGEIAELCHRAVERANKELKS